MKKSETTSQITESQTPLEQSNSANQLQSFLSGGAIDTSMALTSMKKKLKVRRKLTLPLFSMAHRPILVIKVLSEPKLLAMNRTIEDKKQDDPEVVTVLDLDTGEEGLLIVNALIKSAFAKVEGSIVGKFFAMRSLGIRDGKRYRDIQVIELTLEEGEQ